MRHKLLIALFAFGAVAGFGSGFHHLAHRCEDRRDAMKRELAALCVEAARSAAQPAAPAATLVPAISDTGSSSATSR